MRIISGVHKSIIINPPAGLPVRPTTDRAKESLFNILENHFNLDQIHVLDLFSGTGNIAYEFVSRGAESVTAVDINFKCVEFIKSTKNKLNMMNLSIVKKDAFQFLNNQDSPFDIIFADAPYALSQIIEIPRIVEQKKLLKEGGWLIVEHETLLNLDSEVHFFDKRIYGQSAFSFFKA